MEDAKRRSQRSDPRIHERRVAVARQLGRSRLRRILVVTVLVAVAAGALALVHSSFFGARHVVVTGEDHTSRAAVIRAAGLSGAPPLVDLDAAVIARKVERLPWVDHARVSVSWPWDVTIRVTERVPVAAVQLGAGRFAVSDRTGRVLEVVSGRPVSLPLLAGVARVPPPGRKLSVAARALTAAAAAMPESMVRETSALRLGSDGVEVVLADGLVGLVGAPDMLTAKFVSLATVLAHGGLAGIGTIDVRVPAAPVLIRKVNSPIVPGIGGG